ncbi:MAG: hypothetical protein NVSMB64_21670 [Candidatus Velthaea sp.]
MFKHTIAFLCACGIVSAGLPATASDSASGIAFDQVDRTVATGERPSPGSFKTDYELALRVAKNGYSDPASAMRAAANGARGTSMAASAVSMIPGIGGLLGGFAAGAAARAQQAAMRNRIKSAMNNAMEEQSAGTLTHYAFLNAWERVEKPDVSAVIIKHDLKQTIYLDLRKKTYVRYSGLEDGSADAAASAAAGTGRLQSSVNVTAAPARDIDGQKTSAVETSYHTLLTDASGACGEGASEVRALTYYAADIALPAPLAAKDLAPLESLTLQPGCVPKIVRSGEMRPDGRLYVYRIVDVNGGAATAGVASDADPTMFGGGGRRSPFGAMGAIGPASAAARLATTAGPGTSGNTRSYTRVIERGNLTVLGANAAALFEIPADFTEAK